VTRWVPYDKGWYEGVKKSNGRYMDLVDLSFDPPPASQLELVRVACLQSKDDTAILWWTPGSYSKFVFARAVPNHPAVFWAEVGSKKVLGGEHLYGKIDFKWGVWEALSLEAQSTVLERTELWEAWPRGDDVHALEILAKLG